MAERRGSPMAGTHPLTRDDVLRIARLARLSLPDEEVERSRERMSAVLGYMDGMRRLDLTGVEPMSHPGEATNALAADEPGPTLGADALAGMASEVEGAFVKVPKVLGEGGGA